MLLIQLNDKIIMNIIANPKLHLYNNNNNNLLIIDIQKILVSNKLFFGEL